MTVWYLKSLILRTIHRKCFLSLFKRILNSFSSNCFSKTIVLYFPWPHYAAWMIPSQQDISLTMICYTKQLSSAYDYLSDNCLVAPVSSSGLLCHVSCLINETRSTVGLIFSIDEATFRLFLIISFYELLLKLRSPSLDCVSWTTTGKSRFVFYQIIQHKKVKLLTRLTFVVKNTKTKTWYLLSFNNTTCKKFLMVTFWRMATAMPNDKRL